MAVDVDEAGRERQATRVNLYCGIAFEDRAALNLAERCDSIAAHCEAANERRRAGAIEDARAANDYVVAIAAHIRNCRGRSGLARPPLRSRPARLRRRERSVWARGPR